MTAIQKPIIGTISYQQQAKQTQLFLPCLVSKATPVNILVLDEKGRQIAERKMIQKAAFSTISLNIPLLKAGFYNCWISIDGKMHVQQLDIAKGKKNKLIRSLFNRQMNT